MGVVNSMAARGVLEWGAADAARPEEMVSGDLYVVEPFAHGVLIAVVDGVGHGADAAAAARIVAATLRAFAHEPPIPLVLRCHEELKGTRGAVMTVASLDHGQRTLTWLGVGNVEAVVMRARAGRLAPLERVLLRGGVVGHQLPPLQASVFPIVPGDLLLMATDGIRPGFAEETALDGEGALQEMAERILADHRTGTDDALVIVARYVGRAA